MAAPGVDVVRQSLRKMRQEFAVDVVIAQAENVTDGRGMSVADYQQLRAAGVDGFTGGNWTLHLDELIPLLNDPNAPVVRPANYPAGTPGLGYKYLATPKGTVLIISLLGKIVGKDAERPVDNPLQVVDDILRGQAHKPRTATVVNLHGDFSSEKVVIGHYLDGRASVVVGDHWHVPTADARILPCGTAHMTDVGMCGVLNSSLGVTLDSVIPRWRDGHATRNVMASDKPLQINGLLAAIEESTGLATTCQYISRVIG